MLLLATLLSSLYAFALPVAPAFGEGSVDFNQGEDARFRNPLLLVRPLLGMESRYPVFRVYAQAGETIQMGSSPFWGGCVFNRRKGVRFSIGLDRPLESDVVDYGHCRRN